jgi:hypothetical protein
MATPRNRREVIEMKKTAHLQITASLGYIPGSGPQGVEQ